MADTSALSQFAHYTDPTLPDNKGPYTDLESQTDLYFKIIHGVLEDNQFTDSADYEDTFKKKIGLNNETQESDVFKIDGTYMDSLQKNGSAILQVNGSQVGNQTVAQTEDYKAYDAYYKQGK